MSHSKIRRPKTIREDILYHTQNVHNKQLPHETNILEQKQLPSTQENLKKN